MSDAPDRPVIIIGDDLIAVALAAGLVRYGMQVQVLVESTVSRARSTAVPGLLLPSGPGMAQTEMQRYERWLTDLGIGAEEVAFDVLPLTRETEGTTAGGAVPTEIGVIDLTRLRAVLANRLHAAGVGVEPARGAQPERQGEQIIGIRQSDKVQVAREVVLASGLRLGRFWRLPLPADAFGRRAVLRDRADHPSRSRYTFPFDGRVCVSGAPAIAEEEVPAAVLGATARAQQMHGIGPEAAVRSYAVGRHAPGLVYTSGNGGQGLLALPLMMRRLLDVLGAVLHERGGGDDVPDPI